MMLFARPQTDFKLLRDTLQDLEWVIEARDDTPAMNDLELLQELQDLYTRSNELRSVINFVDAME